MTTKSELFLKIIIAQKAVFAVIELFLSLWTFSFVGSGGQIKLVAIMNSPTSSALAKWSATQVHGLGESTLMGTAIMLMVIAIINGIEGWGLHIRRRWAEWLTVIATGVFIPFEIYLIVQEATVPKILLLILNVVVVYFLAEHKELFKSKKQIKREELINQL